MMKLQILLQLLSVLLCLSMMLLAFAVVNVSAVAVVKDATDANNTVAAIVVVNDNEVANVAAAAAIGLVVIVNNAAVTVINAAAAVNDAAFTSLLQLQWSMILKLKMLTCNYQSCCTCQ